MRLYFLSLKLVFITCFFNYCRSQRALLSIGILAKDEDSDELAAFRFGLRTYVKRKGLNMQDYASIDKMEKFYEDNSFKVGSSICRLLYSGVMSYFSLHSSFTLNTFKSFSSTFNMPFVTSSMATNATNQENGFEVYIRPYYVRALFDLIKFYGWRDIYYFYRTNEGLERLQQLFDVVTEEGYMLKTHVFKVEDVEAIHITLNRLDLQQPVNKNLFLDMSIRECQSIINKQYDTVSPAGIKHSFILVGLGMNEMECGNIFKGGGINITGLTLIDTNNKNAKSLARDFANFQKLTAKEVIPINVELGLIIEAGYFMGNAIYEYGRKNKLINRRYNESLNCDHEPIKKWSHGRELVRFMKDIDMKGLLTGRIRFDEYGLRKGFKLDIMEVSLNRGLAKIGSWDSTEGLRIQQPTMMRQKGTKIVNKTRVITSIFSAPHLILKKDPDLKGNDRYEGYCADLSKILANIIRFDYVLKPVDDGKYGDNKTGKWDGMVGELLTGTADMAIAPLTITANRESVIDFSKPFMSLGISIMIKKPDKENPSVFSFLNPLSYEVWMCVIFAYIGVSVVLFLVSRFSPFEWHVEENHEGLVNHFTIFNSLWFSLGAFMQQGVDIEPRSTSGRIVGSVWWFFTLILISSYTANLAAFLTSERMQSPIESAEDLAKQTDIKYGTVIGGSTQEFFRKSTIPTYERMWAFMSSTDPWVFVKTADEGVQKVREKNGKYAFLTESTQNEYTNQRKPCNTMKVGGNLDAKGYGIGTPMGSDLRDRVNLAVLELLENGDLANLEKEWWYKKGQCTPEGTMKKKETTSSLKLINVAGIFFILIGGLVLSLIIAAIEHFHKKNMDAKKNEVMTDKESGARISLTGGAEITQHSNLPLFSFSYAVPGHLTREENYNDSNLHTQV